MRTTLVIYVAPGYMLCNYYVGERIAETTMIEMVDLPLGEGFNKWHYWGFDNTTKAYPYYSPDVVFAGLGGTKVDAIEYHIVEQEPTLEELIASIKWEAEEDGMIRIVR